MGTSRSAAELAGKFDKVGRLVTEHEKDGNQKVADFLKTTALALARPPTGGDLVFRNNRKRHIGVKQNPEGKAVRVSATGPMRWLEEGVRKHSIVPGGRRGAGAGLLGHNLRGGAFGPVILASSLISKGNYAASTRGAGVVLKGGFNNKTGFSRYANNAGGLPKRETWTKAVNVAEARQGEIQRLNTVRSLTAVFG